jgi:hypothetical protein
MTIEEPDLPEPHPPEPPGPEPGRRHLLTGLTVGTVGLVGGLVGGAGAATVLDSTGDRGETVVLDCACLGDTWRMTLFEGAGESGDLRGSPFSVEGILYPGGHLPEGDGFVPTLDEAIGHWFCRGHMILHPGRPLPHLMSNQEYVVGLIDADRLFPPDMLTTVGLEGTEENFERMHRAITGGTGLYRGARGECSQYFIGANSTVFADDPTVTAPNIRFEFDLSVPD